MSAFSGLTSAHIFSITINSTVSASKVKSKVKPKAVVVCLADGAGHNGSPENNNFLIADNALMISILLKINKQWLKYSTSVNTPSIVIIVIMFS